MKKIEYTSNKTDRILAYVCSITKGLSYAYASELLKRRDIRINGEKVKENVRVELGDTITLFIDEARLKIVTLYSEIYRDEQVLVIDKYKGIEVCDGKLNLVNEIARDLKLKVYPVHRIDRNTDGLVIFALTKESEKILLEAFKQKNSIKKTYLAEVTGIPKNVSLEKAYLIKRSKDSLVEVSKIPSLNSKVIETQYKTIEREDMVALLEVTLITGRTHQIRAHLAYLGLPILGDLKYGDNEINEKYKVKELHLTSFSLTFRFEEDSLLSYLNKERFIAKPQWKAIIDKSKI